MPDGNAASKIIYAPARRKDVGVLIMLAGPSGSGKTLSALLLAKGLAGPQGKIAFCDTENDRALYYADRFDFLHYSLSEPFRPSRFEAAAVAAQQQKASVWICDSFSHEHVGPGGLLEFFEEEQQRLAGNDFEKRERVKGAAWIKPKGEHKRMLQRLWQLNTHIILCCQAERKTAIRKIENGPKRGKTEFVDLGVQPICGPDIPYAMTMSFLFDVARPGVPIVIKPLLEELVPLIELTKPISGATGARIAAWARGDHAPNRSEEIRSPDSPPAEHPANTEVAPPEGSGGQWRTVNEGDVLNPGFTASMNMTTGVNQVWEPDGENAFALRRRQPDEAQIEAGVKAIVEQFRATTDPKAHVRLIDDPEMRNRLDWLTANRKELYQREIEPAIKESWTRTRSSKPEQTTNGAA